MRIIIAAQSAPFPHFRPTWPLKGGGHGVVRNNAMVLDRGPMRGCNPGQKVRGMMRKTSLILLGAAAGVAATLVTTQPRLVFEGAGAQAAVSDSFGPLSLFAGVFERVRADYVDKPDEHKLVEAAIGGMLARLDPHSSFMDAK